MVSKSSSGPNGLHKQLWGKRFPKAALGQMVYKNNSGAKLCFTIMLMQVSGGIGGMPRPNCAPPLCRCKWCGVGWAGVGGSGGCPTAVLMQVNGGARTQGHAKFRVGARGLILGRPGPQLLPSPVEWRELGLRLCLCLKIMLMPINYAYR